VEPAVAALAGLLFLSEQLTVLQWLAVVLVSAASAGSTLTARRIPPPVEA
jgi:inner membrane transporter RhtA